MRKILYSIGLMIVLFSCDSQKVVSKQNNLPMPKSISQVAPPPKPEIKHKMEGEYFTMNISDPTKSDNTISYGSIVSAKPKGYKVTKKFFLRLVKISVFVTLYCIIQHWITINL